MGRTVPIANRPIRGEDRLFVADYLRCRVISVGAGSSGDARSAVRSEFGPDETKDAGLHPESWCPFAIAANSEHVFIVERRGSVEHQYRLVRWNPDTHVMVGPTEDLDPALAASTSEFAVSRSGHLLGAAIDGTVVDFLTGATVSPPVGPACLEPGECSPRNGGRPASPSAGIEAVRGIAVSPAGELAVSNAQVERPVVVHPGHEVPAFQASLQVDGWLGRSVEGAPTMRRPSGELVDVTGQLVVPAPADPAAVSFPAGEGRTVTVGTTGLEVSRGPISSIDIGLPDAQLDGSTVTDSYVIGLNRRGPRLSVHGDIAYLAYASRGQVFRIDLRTGAVLSADIPVQNSSIGFAATVVADLDAVNDRRVLVAVSALRQVWEVDFSSKVPDMRPVVGSGAKAAAVAGPAGDSPLCSASAVRLVGDTIVVADELCDMVLGVDRGSLRRIVGTGQQFLAEGDSRTPGRPLAGPCALERGDSAHTLWVLECGSGQLGAIDLDLARFRSLGRAKGAPDGRGGSPGD
jgi:hypothetical protein